MANDGLREALRCAASDAREHARSLVSTTDELLAASRRLSAQLADTVRQVHADRRQREIASGDPPDRTEE
jgi:hypothetical protein